MNKKQATAILVAGMHRSGTSALTGALGAVGIALGERLLLPGSDNPKGYWEHEDAVDIHERLLASLGRHWDDVRALPAEWQTSEAARVASAEILEVIMRDFAQSPVWAIKDPRICRFLPLWIAATKQLGINPVVLFVARRPSEVAASIEKRNHWASPIGELLWLRHVLEAEAASRALQRAVVVYDDLLADPDGAVSAVLNRLGIQREGGREAPLKQLVDATDRHHRHNNVQEPSTVFGTIAQTAYEALAGEEHVGDTWSTLQECAKQFDELWRASGAQIDAVADMAHQIRLKEAAVKLDILDLSSKLDAQIRWSEQAVKLRSELRGEYQLALDAIAVGRERLARELESLTLAMAQERREFYAAHDTQTAERECLANELKFERQNHEVRVRELTQRLSAAREEVASLNAAVKELHQSWSWRVTQPLRKLRTFLRAVSMREKG